MTQVIEMVAVDVESVLEHSEDNCPFCKKNEKPEKVQSNKNAHPDDDGQSSFDAKLAINNKSGTLGRKMRKAEDPRPTKWEISDPKREGMNGLANNHKITANPHHLVPGNESLLLAKNLLKWLFKDEPGSKIKEDVGYNVNNAQNGVWLPSNNSMRSDPLYDDMDFKVKFATAAMKASGDRHFHDRHINPYSNFVRDILEEIATRMGVIDSNCPYAAEKSDGDKFDPPYALVDRMNGVSGRLLGFVSTTRKANLKVYTSKLVPMAWVAEQSELKDNFPNL